MDNDDISGVDHSTVVSDMNDSVEEKEFSEIEMSSEEVEFQVQFNDNNVHPNTVANPLTNDSNLMETEAYDEENEVTLNELLCKTELYQENQIQKLEREFEAAEKRILDITDQLKGPIDGLVGNRQKTIKETQFEKKG